jgi:hypothetical protein
MHREYNGISKRKISGSISFHGLHLWTGQRFAIRYFRLVNAGPCTFLVYGCSSVTPRLYDGKAASFPILTNTHENTSGN